MQFAVESCRSRLFQCDFAQFLEVSTRLGDILDALDLEFGFSRVDFPPKGSKTQSFCVILAKTSFFKLPVGIPTGSSALKFQQVVIDSLNSVYSLISETLSNPRLLGHFAATSSEWDN